jgi:hypothetical protein
MDSLLEYMKKQEEAREAAREEAQLEAAHAQVQRFAQAHAQVQAYSNLMGGPGQQTLSNTTGFTNTAGLLQQLGRLGGQVGTGQFGGGGNQYITSNPAPGWAQTQVTVASGPDPTTALLLTQIAGAVQKVLDRIDDLEATVEGLQEQIEEMEKDGK